MGGQGSFPDLWARIPANLSTWAKPGHARGKGAKPGLPGTTRPRKPILQKKEVMRRVPARESAVDRAPGQRRKRASIFLGHACRELTTRPRASPAPSATRPSTCTRARAKGGWLRRKRESRCRMPSASVDSHLLEDGQPSLLAWGATGGGEQAKTYAVIRFARAGGCRYSFGCFLFPPDRPPRCGHAAPGA